MVASSMLRVGVRALSAAAAGVVAVRGPSHCFAESPNRSRPNKNLSRLRKTDFPIQDQWYGKLRVRVMKVRKETNGEHSVSEYTVQTKLFGDFEQCYTEENNERVIATDTQKNNVYLVAKRTGAPSPEQFGVDIAKHFLNEYPQLEAVEIEVRDHPWDRAVTQGGQHEHGFVRKSPEYASALVKLSRSRRDQPEVISSLRGFQVLKTTQSGWENFYTERYTTLPPTDERLMCTEVSIDWTYTPTSGGSQPNYANIRKGVIEQVSLGFFGPPKGGVYSHSVQSTIYDIASMVLENEPSVNNITLNTPNIHQIPQKDLLQKLGETFENDIYMPTSDPAGDILVSVGRDGNSPGTVTHSAPRNAPITRGGTTKLEKVKGDIKTALINMKSNACPMAMRVSWHASGTWDTKSGTGGSHGATMRFEPEFTDEANNGLTMMIDMLKPVKDKNPEVSIADIWALSGAAAIEFLGGPEIPFAFGRADATGRESGCPRTKIPENGRLPDALQGAQHLRDVFYRQGFTDREIVALSGGHTLGRCHKVRSGFDGPWTDNPLMFDNSYFKHLMDLEWRERKGDWDGKKQYEDVETQRLIMLPSDMALRTDPVFSKVAREYADNQEVFFRDFALAFSKLLHNGCDNKPPELTGGSTGTSSRISEAPVTKQEAGLRFREYAMHGSTERLKPYAKLTDVNEKESSSGRTALHKAAFWGHIETITYLLDDCKAKVNVQDFEGDTPLHDAVRFGHAPLVDKLLRSGADRTIKNGDGKDALSLATEYGKKQIAERLRR